MDLKLTILKRLSRDYQMDQNDECPCKDIREQTCKERYQTTPEAGMRSHAYSYRMATTV